MATLFAKGMCNFLFSLSHQGKPESSLPVKKLAGHGLVQDLIRSTVKDFAPSLNIE